jgi:hypothetical protein
LSIKLSEAEYAAIATSAHQAGLSMAAYASQAAVKVAGGAEPLSPGYEGDAAKLRELVDARTQVRRFGQLVNQALAALHSTGEQPAALGPAITACTQAVKRLDEATVTLMRRS